MKAETIGNRKLSAWPVAHGVCWVQTRSLLFARKLSRRADGRLVAWGVSGGILRTFEFSHGMAWARRLIARYQSAEKVTNARLSASNSQATSRAASGVATEGRRQYVR